MSKIKNFWKKYEKKIVIFFGLVLIASISFQSGTIKGQKMKQKQLVIEVPKNYPNFSENISQAAKEVLKNNSSLEKSTIQKKECTFVGSKNSNKYHLPSCRFAKRIKPENLVCFSSAEDAKKKGYVPDKTCIK